MVDLPPSPPITTNGSSGTNGTANNSEFQISIPTTSTVSFSSKTYINEWIGTSTKASYSLSCRCPSPSPLIHPSKTLLRFQCPSWPIHSSHRNPSTNPTSQKTFPKFHLKQPSTCRRTSKRSRRIPPRGHKCRRSTLERFTPLANFSKLARDK